MNSQKGANYGKFFSHATTVVHRNVHCDVPQYL